MPSSTSCDVTKIIGIGYIGICYNNIGIGLEIILQSEIVTFDPGLINQERKEREPLPYRPRTKHKHHKTHPFEVFHREQFFHTSLHADNPISRFIRIKP